MSDASPTDDVLHVRAIKTQAIAIVDDSGRVRAALDCDLSPENRGTVLLQLYDRKGCPRLELQLDDKGPCILLWNETNSPGVSLGVFPQGNGITIMDGDGKPLINVGVCAGRDGQAVPEISVSDLDGNTVFELPRPDAAD